ncbi:SIR2 family protein [Bradyrhizobium diazoefficiens]|uniref:SIR2 family NAD-dependent protein deacylase n=1 Tax=Bradyrhizobium diazoefficiens TaxID=1355477 RepID=UPI00272D824C|nr:SIR2 family protein [Bradyrhizobium diazoefficiens]WLA74087.1 SIR2 family protein [Bradyrhizobium diazoefficiens]
MMALGDKFEAQKGSARLRAALETAVPDDDYAPGLAHQLLVRLPWADIFTTNWDSLLERAVDTYDRSYDAVVTVEQIASTSAPRIVKLHGCARSGTRLIFTEEDFRTYPKAFAPFVSLVQQSLMENVLVLFGFSGADPNFRAWHGWVRDHLGSNIQPIYMVNLRPTDPIDVNLMAGRLINQIDLSQKREWQGLSASETIEGFLSEIHRRLRALRVNLDWPSSRRTQNNADPSGKSAASYRDWQVRLEAYPQWLVAPARNRSDLLLALDEALTLTFDPEIERGVFAKILERHEPVVRSQASMLTERERTALVVSESLRIALARPGDRLLACMRDVLGAALNDIFGWRPTNQEIASFDGMHEHFVRTFDLVGKSDESSRADSLIKFELTGIRLQVDVGLAKEIIIGLLPLIEIVEREARFRDDETSAQLLRNVLWLLGGEAAGREFVVRSALAAALTRLQIQEISLLLNLWPEQPHDATSNLRRAALLREIGWIRESYFEISNTVARLRSLGSARRRIVKESSLEGWAFYLYADLLEANKEKLRPFIAPYERNLSLNEVIVELHERLDELETNRCDPRREIDRLSRDMETATVVRRLAPDSLAGAANSIPLQQIVADPASTFVILSETVGVSVGHVHGTNRMALTSAKLLARDSRNFALGLTLRAGMPEDLPFRTRDGQQTSQTGLFQFPDQELWYVTDAVFESRYVQSDLSELTEELDRLISPSSPQSEHLVDAPYLDRKIRLLQHLTAGLMARCDKRSDWPAKIFSLATRVARSPIISATRAGWSNQLQLFESTLRLVPAGGLTAQIAIRELLDLPVPSISDDSIIAGWPDPIRLLVSAWYPGEGTNSGPNAELRNLGQSIAKEARSSISRNASLRSEFNEARRALKRALQAPSPHRALVTARRIALLDAVLPRNTR